VVNEEKKSKTIKYSIILSIIISLVIIFLILYFTIDVNTFDYFSRAEIKYEYFLIAFLLQIASWFIWGARLKILSHEIEKNFTISLWESTKIIIANLFLAAITPSMAGGEPVRIYLLKEDGLSVGAATASVLGERLLDALLIIICVPFAFFIFKNYIEIGYIQIGLSIGIFIFAIIICLFILSIKYPNKTKSFLFYINKKLDRFVKNKGKNRILDRINTEVDNFHRCMIYFITEGKKIFLIAGSLTILYWGTILMIPSMLFLGLGLKPFYILSFSAQILLIVVIMMPTTPGSSGIAEGLIAGLYSVLIGSSLIGIFILIFRFITYHFNLIVGAIFQYRIFKSVASFSFDVIDKKNKK
jgi:uncharacterized protein (TIRG00374 family)